MSRGWANLDRGSYALTAEGERVHDAILARVQTVRANVTAGIPDADYATTMATLERIATNVGWDPGRRPVRRGRARTCRSAGWPRSARPRSAQISNIVTRKPVTKFNHRKRRHPRFAEAAFSSSTPHHGSALSTYGTASSAASASSRPPPSAPPASSRMPASR